jgi:hypothetical protein
MHRSLGSTVPFTGKHPVPLSIILFFSLNRIVVTPFDLKSRRLSARLMREYRAGRDRALTEFAGMAS